LNDLTINSGAKLTINAGKSLTVTGALTNNSAEGIILQSPENHGAPGSLITNGSITGSGTIKAERYILAYSGNSDGWHLISSPVNTPNIANNTNLAPGDNDDLFAWNEVAYEWTNYKPGNVFTTMTNGIGYLVAYQVGANKYMTGTPNNTAISYSNLSNTNDKGEGWHLVGNPYPSAITWDKTDAGFNLTNIAGVAKVMNNSGSYSDRAANTIIPAMQGFFVQAVVHNNNSFNIPLLSRTHDNSSWLKSGNGERFMLVANDLETAMFQESVIGVNELATEGYDYQYDSRFWAWYAPQFYSIVGDDLLSTNTLPSVQPESVIPFGFVKNESSSFSIELKEQMVAYTVYLSDLKANQEQNLTSNPVYTFTSEAGDDPNRFILHFAPVGISTPTQENPAVIYSHGGVIFVTGAPANAEITVSNLTGQIMLQGKSAANSLTSLNATTLPKGIYVVSVLSNGQLTSRKVVL